MTTVTLLPYERTLARACGVARNESALRRNSPDRNGPPASDPESQHVRAAGAEMAFAKWSQRYWPGSVDTYKRAGDVGEFEVRWSSKPSAPLRVYPNDPADRPYVLVTGDYPTYQIMGWLWGHEAKVDRWWREGTNGWRGCFAVPQDALYDPTWLLVCDPVLPGERSN